MVRKKPAATRFKKDQPLSEKNTARQNRLNKILLETQNIQNTILEKSLVGYYIVSGGIFRIANPTVLAYTGYRREEMVGNKADFLIHADDCRQVKENARAMLSGNLLYPYEFRIVTKQNEIRWIMETVSSILFQGKPAILGNSMDITRRKLAEEKLMESENLYRTIFETTGTSTIIIEEDKMISLANSEFEKLTGYRKEDWEGKRSWTELIHEDDRRRLAEYHHMRRIDPDAAPRIFECRLIDSQGTIKNILTTACMIPGSKKHVSSSTDVTEMKTKEHELLVKSRNLEDLNAAMRVMLNQRAADREETERTILANVKELVLPHLEKLRQTGTEPSRQAHVDLIKSNLEDILAPFPRKLSLKFQSLSPTEVQVAQFIRDGKNSKEIAGILNVSSDAVDVYRYRIRNKLGLNNKKINLRSYLQSLF